MGNCHFVTQITPKVHKNGAVLKIQEGKEEVFTKAYESCSFQDQSYIKYPEFKIYCQNINEDPNNYFDESRKYSFPYLVVRSGSKYGYGDDLRKLFRHFSKWLEDALFYIEDEYSCYIEKFEIKSGTFMNELVVETDGNLIEYYEKEFPEDKETLLNLIKEECLYLNEDLDWDTTEIIQLINKGLDINNEDWLLWYLRGIVQSFLKKYDESLEALEKSLTLKKRALGGKHDDLDIRGIYCSIAWCLLEAERYEEALPYCEKANEIIPNYGDLRPDEYMGYAYLNLKRYDKALEIFNALLRSANKKSFIAYALYNKAFALSGLGKFDQASGFMAAAFSLSPYDLPKKLKNDPDSKPLLQSKNFKDFMGDEYALLDEVREWYNPD